ncbi:MAG: sigma-70 family RNA polymerase sigma factor [Mucilaginibacter sp.]|nr:sigma-70 family RNA polymerase sigma factor [Mucilaginibacter sp.]
MSFTTAAPSSIGPNDFEQLYKLHFMPIKGYVLKNSGTDDDAKDVFQETLLVLIDKLNNGKFVLTAGIGTYLFAVAKNIWLNKLKERSKIAACPIDDNIPEITDSNTNREEQLFVWIRLITSRCQYILKSIFFMKLPMAQLAAKMGWKNSHTADNQKYKCLQQLKKVSK